MRILVAFLLLSYPLLSQTAVVGAQLRAVSVDLSRGTWEAELANVGAKTITGYVIQTISRHPDGTTAGTGHQLADLIQTVPPPNDAERRRRLNSGMAHFPIEPGEFVVLKRNHAPSTGPDGSTMPFEVSLHAVIYEDGSVEGDAKGAEMILGNRRAQWKVLDRYLSKLTALRESPDPGPELKSIYRQLADEIHELDRDPDQKPSPELFRSKSALSMMQMEIRNLLQGPKQSEFFRSQIARMEHRYEALGRSIR